MSPRGTGAGVRTPGTPRFDYTTIGHVTADVMADGTTQPGGTAFYSALQAARLGARTLIVTQGVGAEIEAMLAPFAAEFELQVIAAAHTTTLLTDWAGRARKQRLLAWAGPIDDQVLVDSAVLHLAPVARETPTHWRGRAGFVGLTPQGLVRSWPAGGGEIRHEALTARLLPERCDAIVISQTERDSCATLICGPSGERADEAGGGGAAPSARPRASGALLAVTAAAAAIELRLPGGETQRVGVAPVERFVDDIGAGDVFAAAFFLALNDGRRPRQAAAFGSAAAAVRIAGLGPAAIGGRAAIEERLGASR